MCLICMKYRIIILIIIIISPGQILLWYIANTSRTHTHQGLKVGRSCGPSLRKRLADHQIVLSGGPVVYWKLLTINFDIIFLMCRDTFYDQCHIIFNIIYLLQVLFKMSCTVAGNYVGCV